MKCTVLVAVLLVQSGVHEIKSADPSTTIADLIQAVCLTREPGKVLQRDLTGTYYKKRTRLLRECVMAIGRAGG